jgi:hypothetical protein
MIQYKRGIEVKESMNIGAKAMAKEVSEVYFEGTAIVIDKRTGKEKTRGFVCDTIHPSMIINEIIAGKHEIPMKVRLRHEYWKNHLADPYGLERIEIRGLEYTFICEASENYPGGVIIPENHKGEFLSCTGTYYQIPE